MTGEENLMKKRFEELSERSYFNGIYTFTEFLSPAEQALLRSSVQKVPYSFFGGFEGAEKAIAVFGSEELCGYVFEPPVSFVKIEPASQKFSDELSAEVIEVIDDGQGFNIEKIKEKGYREAVSGGVDWL